MPVLTILSDIKSRFKLINTEVLNNFTEDIYKLTDEIILTHTHNKYTNILKFTKNGLCCCFENYPSYIKEDKDGNYYYCEYQQIFGKTSKLHRVNGPARVKIMSDVKKILYYENGLKHRLNKPAIIEENNISIIKYKKDFNQTFIYYKNGYIHRDEDKPAKIHVYGKQKIKYWYKNGERHRDNLPAIIEINNNKIVERVYCQHDEVHRLDGPAIIKPRYKLYSLFGKYMSPISYKIFLFKLKHIKSFEKSIFNERLTKKQLLEVAEYNNFKKTTDYLLTLTVLDELT